MKKTKAKNVSEFIAAFPAPLRQKLKKIREIALKHAPGVTEKIGYGMPAYHLNGVLFYFNAYDTHIGFYAMPPVIVHFQDELVKYETSKGTIRLPVEGALPIGLLTKIVKFSVKRNLEKKSGAAAYHRARRAR